MTRHFLNILLLLILWNLHAAGQSSAPLYPDEWLTASTGDLYDKGIAFMNENRPDSALACYSLAASRYHNGMSRAEKIKCAEAYIGQWDVYFLYFFDYEKSYESLMRAKEIYDGLGMTNPRIYMELGGLYEVMAEQTQTASLNTKAIDYYRQAFAAAEQTRDVATLNFSLLNAVMLAYRTGSLPTTADLWQRYEHAAFVPQDSMRQFCKLIYLASTSNVAGRYDEGIAMAEATLPMLSLPDKSHARLLFSAYLLMADAHARQGNYTQALQVMEQGLALQKEADIRDNVLIALRLVSEYSRKVGNQDVAMKYHQELLELKDSLISYRQLNNLSGLEYNYQLTRLNEQINEANAARRKQNVIIAITSVGAAVIGLFLLLFLLKNRRLKQANVHLYQKNVELMKLEQQHIAELNAPKVEPVVAEPEPETVEVAKPKYDGNNLSEGFKDRLFQTIEAFMSSSEMVFDPGFGLQQLANAVGSNSSYVSQVINERTGGNFSAFLNRYRIREACKRINDEEQYGQLTLEAISDSVGFKSRTTFRRSFKLITGLNPSEYLHIARGHNHEKQ